MSDWNNIGRHLAFRDYMRTHEKERMEYAKLKKNLRRNSLMTLTDIATGKKSLFVKLRDLLNWRINYAVYQLLSFHNRRYSFSRR